MVTRVQIHVRGIVQGVGFRPFVYSLAQKHNLKGRVFNDQSGVLIDVEADSQAINAFVSELRSDPPPLARVESIERQELHDLAHYQEFLIEATATAGRKFVPISPDLATCADCLRELFDPLDRRFHYPFINCTNCGPRFTIIEDVPYDRARTTMSEFTMCSRCREEYENPADRRFHAEPIACAECGPKLWLVTATDPGSSLSPPRERAEAVSSVINLSQLAESGASDDPIEATIALIRAGKIVAIKGIGGFHLACDALNEAAVVELRRRKYREDKPFALMARDLELVEQYCVLSQSERELLSSSARPIVLLERKSGVHIPASIAPRVTSLGFMLPYAPLHHLLLQGFETPLVMTSANVSDEPICYEDEDARKRLSNIADYFLSHDRRIHMRMDDSVVRVKSFDNATSVIRRSRGFAPAPLRTGLKFERQILACGAELKNTFCLARAGHAFVSHHIGDLENLETLKSFTDGIEHYKRLFYLEPEIVAYDLHPEYLSTKYALALESIETKVGVQHHHAHIASCMADNSIDGDVIGVAMDGLGFGADGRMWGGEFFVANLSDAQRVAHLEYMPLPGGARAIREPWRMAAAYLHKTFGDEFTNLNIPFVSEMDTKTWLTLRKMIVTGTNCPETSSVGRLFDAVSSLLRLRDTTNYEGQAAIELEQIADPATSDKYELEVSEDGSIIRAQEVIRRTVEDLLSGVSPQIISARFHLGMAELIARLCVRIRDEHKLNRVVLSGGVFQNMFLLKAAVAMLSVADFEVFTHQRVPTNDGGISLGQAAIANRRCTAGC